MFWHLPFVYRLTVDRRCQSVAFPDRHTKEHSVSLHFSLIKVLKYLNTISKARKLENLKLLHSNIKTIKNSPLNTHPPFKRKITPFPCKIFLHLPGTGILRNHAENRRKKNTLIRQGCWKIYEKCQSNQRLQVLLIFQASANN